VAVGQTSDAFDFLCVCHKVMSLRRSILVAERPLLPAEPLSRGQQRWLLSNSYMGLGLSDSHATKQSLDARGPRRTQTCEARKPDRLSAVLIGHEFL